MAGQSSDIELIAGLSGGGSISGKSGQRIKSQLDSIMGEINKKPFKINVELNEKNLNNFRQEFEKMARDARTAAERIESAFDGIEIGKIKGSDNVRDITDNLTNRNKKLKQAYRELQIMERNLFKWSSSESGKSASSFDDYLSQGVALERLIQQLENGEISLKDFSESFVDIQTRATKAASQIAYFGENAKEVQKLTEGTTEYLSAMQKVNKTLETAKSNSNKWSAAKDAANAGEEYEKSAEAYANIQTQISNLEALKSLLAEGSLTAAEFSQQLSEIKLSLDGSYGIIKGDGFDYSEDDAIEKYAKQLKEIDSLIEQNKNNLKEWSRAKNGEGAVEFKGIEEQIGELERLRRTLVDTGKAVHDFDRKVAAINSSTAQSAGKIKDLNEDSKTFGDKVLGIAKEVADYIDVMDVVFEAVAYGKRMVGAVTDIDTAMTELRKVTDETNATYASFLENASTRAEDFGATVADVVSASADFARLGHDLGDASALADAAIVYKNVGDGINDIDTASSSIISTMQAFGIEASNAMSIVDSFNAIGNNFAVSSQGVGDALLNSAASLAAAGNDIHEAVALIAAANTTIQDPGRVGKMFAQQHSNVLKEDSYIG